MSYFPKPSLNENDLAIIERGNTAAHSIEAGQYVSWHGRTGKAKAAILQGATLSDSLFDYDEDGVLNTPLGVHLEVQNVSATGSSFITLVNIGANKKLIKLDGVFKIDNGVYVTIGMDMNLAYNPSNGNITFQQTWTSGTLSGTIYIHYLEG